jgi:hypothetical protein
VLSIISGHGIGLIIDETQRAQRTQSVLISGSSPISLQKRVQGFKESGVQVFVIFDCIFREILSVWYSYPRIIDMIYKIN